MDIKCYVTTLKSYKMPREKMYIPIQVGSALYEDLGYQRDDSGDNISSKNPTHSEYTAFYWVWKNVKCDVIGMNQYRRYFTLANKIKILITKDKYRLLLKREDLVRIFEQDGYDCVLPHKVNLGLQTVEEQYAEKHDIKELYAAGESIKKLYPCYYKYYEEVLKERYAYERNIFFMKKDMFDRYAEFIFTIIGDLEKNYGFQTSRVYAYLGERLINVFLKAEKPKIMELNYVHMEMQLGLWYLKVVFNRILNKIICR